MPSQEDYLDNLLKGIGNTEDVSLFCVFCDCCVSGMSLCCASNADCNRSSISLMSIETSSMSEDEIDRLLQQSREQAGSTEQQKEPDTNENDDSLRFSTIRLSHILWQ